MKQHLLLIGCGSMGSAFALGLKHAHPHWEFSCWTPSGTRAEALAQRLNGHWVKDLTNLPVGITGVVLGFKPQMLQDAQAQLVNLLPGLPFVSLLAAIPLSQLGRTFAGRSIVRVMPNLAVEQRAGVALWCAHGLSPQAHEEWQTALSRLGFAPNVPEEMVNLYTLHGGSAPAFLFQWIKDAGEFARQNGGDPQLAMDILVQTWRGTLLSPPRFEKLDERIGAVASKGGVTQAVLDHWSSTDPGYIGGGFAAGLKRLGEMQKNKT